MSEIPNSDIGPKSLSMIGRNCVSICVCLGVLVYTCARANAHVAVSCYALGMLIVPWDQSMRFKYCKLAALLVEAGSRRIQALCQAVGQFVIARHGAQWT